MKCPKCLKEVDNSICQDGGSRHCSNCEIKFHYCSETVKYGSPGPGICPDCKNCWSSEVNYLASKEFLYS